MFTKLALGLALLALGVYGGVEAWPLVAGPSLTIRSPEPGTTVPGGVTSVRGAVERVSGLSLNGMPILPDETGAFVSTLAFSPGTTILTFVAKDRFGRSITTTRTIFVP